jgi:RHS repeat-associated protein
VEDNGITSVEEHYIMDGGTVLAVTDANGNIKHWNLYGNGLIGRLEDSGTKKYYVRDHLGSTRQVINDSSTPLEYYDYYPFGLVLRSDVAGQETKETFTGKEQVPATGYYYFGSRYYDAALAGWGTTDPAGQFASPYVYAGNPVSYVDPNGEFAFTSAIILGLKIASAAKAAHNIYQGYSQGGLNGGIQALMGTAAGYIASAGISSSGLFNFGNSFGGAVASGAVQGGISGGGVTAMYGGNFFDGALQGGLDGAATSGGQWLALKGAMAIDASIATRNSSHSNSDLGSDQVLHEIAKDDFGAEVGKRGLAKLTGQEVPNGYKLSNSGAFTQKVSWIERLFGINPGTSAEGLTRYLGNRQSEVYIAPSAYENYRRLYLVLGHELVHVQHYYAGLWEKHRSYFGPRSEYAAYQWIINAAQAKGWYILRGQYIDGMKQAGYSNTGYNHMDFICNDWY